LQQCLDAVGLRREGILHLTASAEKRQDFSGPQPNFFKAPRKSIVPTTTFCS
jgi:hypothetical protein